MTYIITKKNKPSNYDHFHVFIKVLSFFLILLSFACIVFEAPKNIYFSFFPFALLFLSLFLLFYYRKNSIIFFIFLILFYFIYSICIGFYFFPNGYYSFLIGGIKYERTWELGISILLLFLSCFSFFLRKLTRERILLKFPHFSNSSLCLLPICLCFFIFLGSLFYPSSTLMQRMAEYCIILLAFASLAAKTKEQVFCLFFVTLLGVVSNFLHSGRVMAIELLLVPSLVFIIKKMSWKTILIFSIIGILIFTYIGLLGDGFSVETITFSYFMNVIQSRKFTLDTAVFAYYCSMTFVESSSFFSFPFRINHFLFYLVSCLFGGSFLETLGVPSYMYSLQDLTRLTYIHWNGGILPFYFYFWGGQFGVVLVGLLTSILFNFTFLNSHPSLFSTTLLIVIASSFMRWFLYFAPVRTILLTFFFSCLFYFLQRNMFKKRHFSVFIGGKLGTV